MAKRRAIRSPTPKGRSNSGARFLQLHHWLLKSTAYRRSSLAARGLLIEVMARYNGQNNGEISMSVREAAEKLNVGKDRASRAFHELQELGFLRIVERGSFNRKVRHASTWHLTMFESNGEPATKNFMRWDESKTRSSLQGPTVLTTGTDRVSDTLPATPKTPLTVLTRGTVTPIHGPHHKDTSSLPAGGGPERHGDGQRRSGPADACKLAKSNS